MKTCPRFFTCDIGESPARHPPTHHFVKWAVITSSPSQTSGIHPTHAELFDPRQLWRHWCHLQRSKFMSWRNQRPTETTYAAYGQQSIHELKLQKQQHSKRDRITLCLHLLTCNSLLSFHPHLGLQRFLPSGFPAKILYEFLTPSMHAACLSAHLILLLFMTLIIFLEEYKLWRWLSLGYIGASCCGYNYIIIN
jgi:hypothetical protein